MTNLNPGQAFLGKVSTLPINVKKLMLVSTSHGYADQFNRSYNMTVTAGEIQGVEAAIADSGVGRNFKMDPNFISKYIPNIAGLSAAPVSGVYIPNGWNTQRFRYILETEYVDMGVLHSCYIQGFTNYVDNSLISQLLDPNMTFYINSITVVRKQFVPNPDGTARLVVTPIYSYNVVTDYAGREGYQLANDQTELLRPVDVLNSLAVSSLYDNIPTNNVNDLTSNTKVNRTMTSSKSNNESISYFAKTINSVIDGKANAGYGYSMSDVLNSAANNVEEQYIMSNPFVANIFKQTGETSPTTFTLNVLKRITPHIPTPDVFDNTNNVIDNRFTFINSTVSEHMHIASIENTTAQTITNSVSSFMSDLLLQKAVFTISNMSGQVVVEILGAKSFVDGIDIPSSCEKLKHKLGTILHNKISKGGYLMYNVLGECDLLKDTVFQLTIENSGQLIYRFPTFADSLNTPVLTDFFSKQAAVDTYSNFIDCTYRLSNKPTQQHSNAFSALYNG